MLRSSQNRYLDAVASDTTDLTVIRNELAELGFQIESSEIPAIHSSRSWVHFAFEAGA